MREATSQATTISTGSSQGSAWRAPSDGNAKLRDMVVLAVEHRLGRLADELQPVAEGVLGARRPSTRA
jgi:hypothetical protein